ncbi:amidohydrolase family protein [Pinibacter aurantiacus]|uniref:Peptidase M19 n=1 Tax=Pinibacter aurantiacus TaxID=2851599 RepID=A0A9E2W6W3_9BACT|nr:hypothetical protein [Pinibacter aurantiacus]MBV4360499.1 hypothetical protein [Pinibacter aurantiacus]
MPYFDFHLHATLKTLFSQDSSKTSPWDKFDVKAIPWVLKWCSEFEYILTSQSNLTQLIKNNCNLVCVAAYAPERAITADPFLNKQAKGTLSRYLNPNQLDFLNGVNGANPNPYQVVKEDILKVLLDPARFNVQDKKVVVLQKGVAYNQDDHTTLYVVFTVEGAHTLANSYEKNKVFANDVIDNLNDFTSVLNFPVISVNLTHMEQYPFANHAYGILFVSNDAFKPQGKEITPEGIKIVTACYKKNVMIDLKHMSVGARRFLIEQLRTSPDFAAINQPLICTHAGFTGLSFKDIPDYLEYKEENNTGYGYVLWYKPKVYQSTTWTSFNPSSINLYDEEILAILQSGGMIGISLDKRILGFTEAIDRADALMDLSYEEEYISKQEKQYFLTKGTTGQKMTEDYCITNQEILEGGTVNPDASFYHLCHFMSHILHLIKVATNGGYDPVKALTQVCIGSDFDGLINPIWCCPTVESMDSFKKFFIDQFPFFARANKDIVALPTGFDVRDFANKLFFENGRDFVMKRLALLFP